MGDESSKIHLASTAVPGARQPVALLGPACGAEDWVATTTSSGQVTCEVCKQLAGIGPVSDNEQ